MTLRQRCSKPSGRSLATPPMRANEWVSRAPVSISNRSSTYSRSRKQMQKKVCVPRSMMWMPSHRMWLERRHSSLAMVRM